MNNQRMLWIFIFIFGLSGFSGLIYQSIWTHYLKLYLGHASYAQVLVLGIFMGGMAIGSALASRFSFKLTNLILFYGIAEGIIGLFGLGFHQVFIAIQAASYDSIFPALGSPAAVQSIKWLIAAALILPQSILLGATFPLLSAGMLRRFSQDQSSPQTGKTLATLYFVNSLGASIGILCNAFIIIPNVGLPGSLLTAGIINILLALVVYRLSKADNYPFQSASFNTKTTEQGNKNIYVVILALASLTGLASFMYEIGWIRMLTMVLGGSTHSFEIMLSAFILGLALGGWWIRPRIDKFENPIAALGLIQIFMGTLAALTIPLYNYSYEWMSFAMNALNKTDEGYILYSLFSYGISLLIMLPAAFCAGTTLPLATHILLKKGHDDSAIGKVYAWNTLGSIAGIVIATQLVMPLLGLKWVILSGALVDLALGIFLIQISLKVREGKSKYLFLASSLFIASTVFFSFSNTLDTQKMASGVFRYGTNNIQDADIIFHKDGKASTVAVKKYHDGTTVILNNGKPDAGIIIHNTDLNKEGSFQASGATQYSGDEPTMILLGTLPYIYKQNVSDVANIGLGSGLTAHTILTSKDLKKLDTVEIEKQVVEAAKIFMPRVSNAFLDDRSNIIIEDAKTFFAAQQSQYDAIVSEPPNPWVAGVAGLFSQEFYHHIKNYMKEDGVFIQWMHIYEISPALIATIYLALNQEFSDIHFYQVSESDIAIVAATQPLTPDFSAPFTIPDLKTELNYINIFSEADLSIRKLAEKPELNLVLQKLALNANSDFFPALDQGSSKARFQGENAHSLYQLHDANILKQLLYGGIKTIPTVTEEPYIEITQKVNETKKFFQYLEQYTKSKTVPFMTSDGLGQEYAIVMARILKQCPYKFSDAEKSNATGHITSITGWASERGDQKSVSKLLTRLQSCSQNLNVKGLTWISTLSAWNSEQYKAAIDSSATYLNSIELIKDGFDIHLLKINIASQLAQGGVQMNQVQEMSNNLAKIPPNYPLDLELQALKDILRL